MKRAQYFHSSLLINIFPSLTDPKENIALIEWENVWQSRNLPLAWYFSTDKVFLGNVFSLLGIQKLNEVYHKNTMSEKRLFFSYGY